MLSFFSFFLNYISKVRAPAAPGILKVPNVAVWFPNGDSSSLQLIPYPNFCKLVSVKK